MTVLVALVSLCVGAGEALSLVVVGSWQPHHPGLLQVVEEVPGECDKEFEVVGRDTVGASVVVVMVTLTSLLQPNQPGVAQLVVV